jgi:hypothetical protein
MRYSGLRISDVTMLSRESISGRRIKLYTAKTGAHVSMLLPQFVIDSLSSVRSRNPKYFFWSQVTPQWGGCVGVAETASRRIQGF